MLLLGTIYECIVAAGAVLLPRTALFCYPSTYDFWCVIGMAGCSTGIDRIGELVNLAKRAYHGQALSKV